jgi:hypothetical protein
MKATLLRFSALALAGTLFAASGAVALAASTLAVPMTAHAPSLDPGDDGTSFDPAAIAQLSWNAGSSRNADEETEARFSTDGRYLYVRFDATQNKQRIVSAQPVSNGDSVWVEVQSAGNGATYRFAASPSGTGEATASNGAAAPAFESHGAPNDGGYTVTMKIPLSSLPSANAGTPLNLQVGRTIHDGNEQLVWSHDGNVASDGTMTLPASVGRI